MEIIGGVYNQYKLSYQYEAQPVSSSGSAPLCMIPGQVLWISSAREGKKILASIFEVVCKNDF